MKILTISQKGEFGKAPSDELLCGIEEVELLPLLRFVNDASSQEEKLIFAKKLAKMEDFDDEEVQRVLAQGLGRSYDCTDLFVETRFQFNYSKQRAA